MPFSLKVLDRIKCEAAYVADKWHSLMNNSVFTLYTNKYVLPSINMKKQEKFQQSDLQSLTINNFILIFVLT